MFENFLKRQSHVFYIQVWTDRIKVTELNSSETFEDEPVLVYKSEGDQKTILAIGGSSSDYQDDGDSVAVRPFYHDGRVIGDADSAVAIINHGIYTISENLSGRIFSPLLIFHMMAEAPIGENQSDDALKKMLSRRCGAKKVLLMKPDEFLDLDALP